MVTVIAAEEEELPSLEEALEDDDSSEVDSWQEELEEDELEEEEELEPFSSLELVSLLVEEE